MLRALLVASMIWPALCAAQQYPAKPIRWILGYPPGGGTEAILGAEAAARSAPDGYTLFMADNGTFVFHTGIYKKLPYDPVKDFIPIGMIVKGYMLLLTGRYPDLSGAPHV